MTIDSDSEYLRAHLGLRLRPKVLVCLAALGMTLQVNAEPRIAPLPESRWSSEQRAIAASHPDVPVTNDVATYLQHPSLARDILPFERYIAAESTLPARHRELLILRAAWLCRSSYVWARHADAARQAGISAAELRRIAAGPEAAGWDSFEAALLRAADELHVDSFVSDATWTTLAAHYSTEQLIDLVFTVGEFTMISGTVNSLGVEIEADRHDRLPSGIPYTVGTAWTNERLIGARPRIAPLAREAWTPQIKGLLDPNDTGRRIANVYGTYVQNLSMDLLRRRVSEHIRDATTLTDWYREVLLIRIGVLCRSEYEWAAHSRVGRNVGMRDADIDRIVAGPDHPNDDPLEQALMRATDEIYRDDIVADETWQALAARLDTDQLLDALIAIGGYRMFSMAINTFGVQLDPNPARFPPQLR